MGKKTESKDESKLWKARIVDRIHNLDSKIKTVAANQRDYPRGSLEKKLKEMEERIIRMERSFDALGRRLEGSERHVEDEGWFD